MMKTTHSAAAVGENSGLETQPKRKQELKLAVLATRIRCLSENSLLTNCWHRIGFSVFAVLAIITLLPAEMAEAAPAQKLPTLEIVLGYVDRHFADTPDFRPGDIISTSYVTKLFEGLDSIGWNVPDRKALLARVPSDKNFVVQQLRTKSGRKFMQQICNLPLGYDRLFHLSKIPMGHQQVQALITKKDGYTLIEYMTTTEMGKNLGKQLSQTPNGADFNKPTGQIYTVEELKVELKKSYAATLAAQAKPTP